MVSTQLFIYDIFMIQCRLRVIPLEYQNNIFIVNHYAAQKIFFIKDSFSKCDQIRRKLKEFLMENFISCAVLAPSPDFSDKSTCKNQSFM